MGSLYSNIILHVNPSLTSQFEKINSVSELKLTSFFRLHFNKGIFEKFKLVKLQWMYLIKNALTRNTALLCYFKYRYVKFICLLYWSTENWKLEVTFPKKTALSKLTTNISIIWIPTKKQDCRPSNINDGNIWKGLKPSQQYHVQS